MVATFNISTFGRPILTFESPDEITFIRLFFIFVTLIIGILTLFLTITIYTNLCNRQKRYFQAASNLPFLVNFVYSIFILNVIIHNLHYADNIYRPVDYFEPKYLYIKYLLSTMELTFYANFPISYIGTRGIQELFDFDKNGLIVKKTAGYKLFGFIAGSLLTVMHYRIEPPTSYSLAVNFTIAGEGIITIILTAAIIYCLKQSNTNNYHVLNQNDDTDELLLMDDIPYSSKNALTRHRSPRRID
uniref:Uncharacterized protein n=1 Tax=Panagrolaimus sp. PS1159 TaxID=55785 RepID=A0AC35FR35_9BILA